MCVAVTWTVLGSVCVEGGSMAKRGRWRGLATMIATRTAVADTLATARTLTTMKSAREKAHRTNNQTSALMVFSLSRTMIL